MSQIYIPPSSLISPGLRQSENRTQTIRSEEIQTDNALSQIFRLLSELTQILQENRRDFLDNVRADLKQYQEESNDLSSERNKQAWSVAALTFAGLTGTIAAVTASEIADLSPLAQDLFDSFGGVEKMEKLFSGGSQFAEGMKTPANVLSESRATNKETSKQLEQFFYSQGQQAAEKDSNAIEKLVRTGLDLLEKESRTRS